MPNVVSQVLRHSRLVKGLAMSILVMGVALRASMTKLILLIVGLCLATV